MNKRKKEKELRRRYGKLADSMEAYYHHLDFRPFNDLDDDGFAFLLQNVKGVDLLDLDETEIGNQSIHLLSHLQYLKELRLKGCRNLDNGCCSFLNKLTTLELLHVKGTAVTIDGLLQLTNLSRLTTLLFSADDPDAIQEKIAGLHELLPDCKLILNGTPL
ncbi:MAG TPA: hypothetical protein PKE63_02325 [Lacibacter sp.]|nr:hypothetical protein [Lacibacter sp.]HMO90166.1 hypothetical protein [Lacibacter sp.]HMP86081.1 hypothetical protein [Lacibacter sp.]